MRMTRLVIAPENTSSPSASHVLCFHIVASPKKRVHPDRRVSFKKKIKPISNRNFQLKLIPLDAECFKLIKYMCFCPKRSFVACPGGPKVGSRQNMARKSTIFFSLIVPARLFTHRNWKIISVYKGLNFFIYGKLFYFLKFEF